MEPRVWLLLGLLSLGYHRGVLSYRTDVSVQRYKVEGKMCHDHGESCKKAYQKSFECKCPRMRPMCVGPGRYYDARCVPEAWLMYGRLWIQP